MPATVLTDFSPAENWIPQLSEGSLWVADIAGRPEAFLAAHAEGDRLHIDEFAVALEHQGKGLGRQMMSKVVAWAREQHFARLSLTTFRNVPFNAPFYATFGFSEWSPEVAPATIRQALSREEAAGLKNRCAMVMDL